MLPPYVEVVRLDNAEHADGAELLARTIELVTTHVRRRPAANPVQALRKQVESDLDRLHGADLGLFHAYTFATLRQCGASAELASSLCVWLSDRSEPTAEAVEALPRCRGGGEGRPVQARSSRRRPFGRHGRGVHRDGAALGTRHVVDGGAI